MGIINLSNPILPEGTIDLSRGNLPKGTIILKEDPKFAIIRKKKAKKSRGRVIKAAVAVASIGSLFIPGVGIGRAGFLAAKVGLKAIPRLVGLAAKAFGRTVLKHPGKALLVGGLVTTKGGRELIVGIPKTIFKGGQVVGKVVGGEDTGLTVGGALKTAGLLGAAAVGGKLIFDVIKAKKEKVAAVIPSLPGLKDVGVGAPLPAPIGGIPLVPSATITPTGATGAPGQQIRQRPIQNIIQIAVS